MPQGDTPMEVVVDVVSSKVQALDECVARHKKLADWAVRATAKP